MGCNSSMQIPVDEMVMGRNFTSISFLGRLYNPRELIRIYESFVTITEENKTEIKRKLFFRHFRVEETALNVKIFRIGTGNKDNNDKMNFLEYATVLWYFLALDDIGLMKTVFLLFDEDHTGKLNHRELFILMTTLHGSPTSKVRNLIAEVSEGKVTMDINTFVDWCKSNPSLFAPMNHIQIAMRRNACGEAFWKKVQMRRAENKAMDPVHFLGNLLNDVYRIQEEQMQFIAGAGHGKPMNFLTDRSEDELLKLKHMGYDDEPKGPHRETKFITETEESTNRRTRRGEKEVDTLEEYYGRLKAEEDAEEKEREIKRRNTTRSNSNTSSTKDSSGSRRKTKIVKQQSSLRRKEETDEPIVRNNTEPVDDDLLSPGRSVEAGGGGADNSYEEGQRASNSKSRSRNTIMLPKIDTNTAATDSSNNKKSSSKRRKTELNNPRSNSSELSRSFSGERGHNIDDELEATIDTAVKLKSPPANSSSSKKLKKKQSSRNVIAVTNDNNEGVTATGEDI